MGDDRYEWIPLKEYASLRGKSVRTIRRWIALGKTEAMRDGPMKFGPWLVKVPRVEPVRSA